MLRCQLWEAPFVVKPKKAGRRTGAQRIQSVQGPSRGQNDVFPLGAQQEATSVTDKGASIFSVICCSEYRQGYLSFY